MRDESSVSRKSPVRPVQTNMEGSEKAAKSFSSPSALAARMRLNQAVQRNDQRDDGVSVSSTRRIDPGRFSDRASPALSAIADSTAVRSTASGKTSSSKGINISSPLTPSKNTLRNLADVAGLSLHDTPPQGPVDSMMHGTIPRTAAVANVDGSTVGSATTDIDPDFMNAIVQLVSTKEAAASGRADNTSTTDVASLTRQIELMAEKRRASRSAASQSAPGKPTASTPTSLSTPTKRAAAQRPSPEDGLLASPRSQAQTIRAPAPLPAAQERAHMDLKTNDNAFSVIADLVLKPFKKGATLSPKARSELNSTVPQHMRESFAEAVRYRLENNCPPGSSQHIHAVTRKCQVLGFAKEGSANPLLALKIETQGATDPKGISPQKDPRMTAAETLARQQLLAELREASNFMAESKTKEAANFWRNHVLELQARLRTLHGDAGDDGNGTDEDIMSATLRLLEEAESNEADASEEKAYVAPSGGASMEAGTVTPASGASQSFSNVSSFRSETSSSGSSEWAEGGILAKGGVMHQLAYLKNLYDMIDLLIILLDIDKLLDFVDAQKIPEKIKDVFKGMDADKACRYLKENGYAQYFDEEYLEKGFQTVENTFDIEKFMDDLKHSMSPEAYNKVLDDMTRQFLGPEHLRESMNLDKIRQMTDPVTLQFYFHQNGLDKVWDLGKLKEIMDAKKLREALEAQNIREVLKSQTMRDFMGDSYRGSNPMVDVVAPSNLPGGYRFEAQIDGHRFLATVPPGGVKKGEMFACKMKDIDSMYSGDIPAGGWRDRLTDFLTHGVCHPVVWTTLFCPLLTLAQVMTRLKYDFLGRPRTKETSPFAVMTSIVILWSTLNVAIFAAYNFKWSQGMELSIADICALAFVNLALWVFAIYATSATRASIRDKYMIREHRCYDLEDCCCAAFAMPFTICQMARHTADYTKHQAVCCTETGLEEGAPLPNTGSNISASNYFCSEAPAGEYWFADDKDLV